MKRVRRSRAARSYRSRTRSPISIRTSPLSRVDDARYTQRAGQARRSRHIYRSLAQFPYAGSSRAELGSDVRIKIVFPYVVFYDHTADTVTILRILHGHRDITAELLARSRGVAPPPRG